MIYSDLKVIAKKELGREIEDPIVLSPNELYRLANAIERNYRNYLYEMNGAKE
jgi:hypothetical protein